MENVVKHSFKVLSDATVHLGTHWYAQGDDFSGVHLNFDAPRESLSWLVGACSDRFAGSVKSCMTMLTQPLFGRENGERLELNTHMDGTVPLRYWIIRENDMPCQDVIDGLGVEFEEFVRSFAAGPMLPMEEWRGRYFCSASIEYRRVWTRTDAQLELRLDVPATATKERFEAFRINAPAGLVARQEAGKNYLRFDEKALSFGYGLFTVGGYILGDIALHDAAKELRSLFDSAAADLNNFSN